MFYCLTSYSVDGLVAVHLEYFYCYVLSDYIIISSLLLC